MDDQDILDMPIVDQDGREIILDDGFFAVGFINMSASGRIAPERPGKSAINNSTANGSNVKPVITVKAGHNGVKTCFLIENCLSFVAIFGGPEYNKFWLFWFATDDPNKVKHTKASCRCLSCDYNSQSPEEREELEEFLKSIVEKGKFPDYNIHRCDNFDQVRDVFQTKLNMSKIQSDRAIEYIKKQ